MNISITLTEQLWDLHMFKNIKTVREFSFEWCNFTLSYIMLQYLYILKQNIERSQYCDYTLEKYLSCSDEYWLSICLDLWSTGLREASWCLVGERDLRVGWISSKLLKYSTKIHVTKYFPKLSTDWKVKKGL